jgi:hypothetical protein
MATLQHYVDSGRLDDVSLDEEFAWVLLEFILIDAKDFQEDGQNNRAKEEAQ